MRIRSTAGFTLLELLVAAAILGLAAYCVMDAINDRADGHIVAVESFKVAGINLCTTTYGGGSPEWLECFGEVMAEYARALAAGDGFDTGNIGSIPTSAWP